MKGTLVLNNDILMVEYIKDYSKGTLERLPAKKGATDTRDVGDEVEFVIWTGGRQAADEPETQPEAWVQVPQPRTFTEKQVEEFAEAIEGKNPEYKNFVRRFVTEYSQLPTPKDKLVWWIKNAKK